MLVENNKIWHWWLALHLHLYEHGPKYQHFVNACLTSLCILEEGNVECYQWMHMLLHFPFPILNRLRNQSSDKLLTFTTSEPLFQIH